MINLSIGKIWMKRIDNYPGQPVIVFLHDSFGCIELWRDFPEKLSEMTGCNVFLYDRLGYGESDPFAEKRIRNYMEKEADLLSAILDEIGIGRAILFGHSDGATISLIAAAKYPEKIAGVISEAAHIFVEEVTLKGIEEAVYAYKTSNLKQKLEKYHGEKTDKLFWAWADIWRSPDFQDWNLENLLSSIICPVMIIQGENDEYGTLKQVEGIEKGVSGAVIKFVVPNVRHTPHQEVPDSVLEESVNFIRELL